MLAGFALGGFRSFGEPQYFAPLSKVTLLAGQNNAGKSNVVRFVERYLKAQVVTPEWEDQPTHSDEELSLGVAYPMPESREALMALHDGLGHAGGVALKAMQSPSLQHEDDGLLWIRYRLSAPNNRSQGDARHWNPVLEPFEEAIALLGQHERNQFIAALSQVNGGRATGPPSDFATMLGTVYPWTNLPPVEVISAFRQITIGTDGGEPVQHGGRDLIQRLAMLQHPSPGPERDLSLARFSDINRFVQDVFEDPAVRIEIPAKADRNPSPSPRRGQATRSTRNGTSPSHHHGGCGNDPRQEVGVHRGTRGSSASAVAAQTRPLPHRAHDQPVPHCYSFGPHARLPAGERSSSSA